MKFTYGGVYHAIPQSFGWTEHMTYYTQSTNVQDQPEDTERVQNYIGWPSNNKFIFADTIFLKFIFKSSLCPPFSVL